MTHIQQRRDQASVWASVNPVLMIGEAGHETDTGKWKLGDGATPWNTLPYKAGVDSVAGKTGAVTLVVGDVAGAAPLADPVFTGNPTAPTPLSTDNDTSVATTAFVKAQGYATIDSPTFTGDPKVPTPLIGDADTSIANTAFVQMQGYQTAPQVQIIADDAVESKIATMTAAERAALVLTVADEGRLVYEADTNRLFVYNGSAWRLVNTEATENGEWQDWTPVVTGFSGWPSNNVRARHRLTGKTETIDLHVELNAPSASGNQRTITIPSSPKGGDSYTRVSLRGHIKSGSNLVAARLFQIVSSTSQVFEIQTLRLYGVDRMRWETYTDESMPTGTTFHFAGFYEIA